MDDLLPGFTEMYSVSLDCKVYAIGGKREGQYSTKGVVIGIGPFAEDFSVLDPQAAPGTQWTALVPMPYQLEGLLAAEAGGKIYV